MTFRNHIPILLSIFLFYSMNGLQVTFVALRASVEGFSPLAVGLFGTAYYAGCIVGTLVTAPLIIRAGYTRIFSVSVAGVAAPVVLMSMFVDQWVWMACRFAVGVWFTAAAMVIESWLNARVETQRRGRILSLYRTVDMIANTSGQYVLVFYGAGGEQIFLFMLFFYCLAIFPIGLTNQPTPAAPTSPRLDIWGTFKTSPVACVGLITIGMTAGAFRTVGPSYAEQVGMNEGQIATFVSLALIGGVLMQFPLGWISDKMDRRWVLIVATFGACAAGLFISQVGQLGPYWAFVGSFLFGACAFPLYSLSVAHANDHAGPEDYVTMAGSLILFWSAGAVVGPTIVAWLLLLFSPSAFFIYTSSLHLSLVLFILYRMGQRRGVPIKGRRGFVAAMRNSPAIFKLAKVDKTEFKGK